jgi:DNA integrity scanning protein DisA with diadenylate cyclase activity
MRHRSAQRFSYDHPSTTIAVVSENGPVTIFRRGVAVGLLDTGSGTVDR